MGQINTVGLLTSGGDAPGMNAAIRAVVRSCKTRDLRVKGIRKGYEGLIHGDVYEMTSRDVSDILNRGGTVLQTARSVRFREQEGILQAIYTARYHGMDAIIVIGGDGSFRGAFDLSKEGMPVVCIPGTIDNDIGCTDYTIGFDTAVNTGILAVDKIRDTASSHVRCNIIKVMGRSSGNIALYVGIATGAEAILIPEIPLDFNRDVAEPINAGKRRSKQHYIIILAEGVKDADHIAERIEEETGIETKMTTLGYLQRGGAPSSRDRVIGSRMGNMAVELLAQGMYNRVVSYCDGKLGSVDIDEALTMRHVVNEEMLRLQRVLSI